MRKFALLSLFAATMADSSTDPRCAPENLSADQCGMYKVCVDDEFECGAKGYPIGYGLFYCQRFHDTFMSYGDKLSPYMHSWRLSAGKCLQEKILETTADLRKTSSLPHDEKCETILDRSFANHAHCYTQTDFSICLAPKLEIRVLLRIIKMRDLVSVRGRAQIAETAVICVQQLLDLMTAPDASVDQQELSELLSMWTGLSKDTQAAIEEILGNAEAEEIAPVIVPNAVAALERI